MWKRTEQWEVDNDYSAKVTIDREEVPIIIKITQDADSVWVDKGTAEDLLAALQEAIATL